MSPFAALFAFHLLSLTAETTSAFVHSSGRPDTCRSMAGEIELFGVRDRFKGAFQKVLKRRTHEEPDVLDYEHAISAPGYETRSFIPSISIPRRRGTRDGQVHVSMRSTAKIRLANSTAMNMVTSVVTHDFSSVDTAYEQPMESDFFLANFLNRDGAFFETQHIPTDRAEKDPIVPNDNFLSKDGSDYDEIQHPTHVYSPNLTEEEEASLAMISLTDRTSIMTPEYLRLEDCEVTTLEVNKLYTLPPVDRELSKLETEFREMLEFFTKFNEADLLSIRDPRIRTIFEGVISSSQEPAVYRAFEVLFEDLGPLRIAGRMIYGKLKQIMLAAQSRAEQEVDAVVEMTGLPRCRVEVSRYAFLALAIAKNPGHEDEPYLTFEQLVNSGIAETAMVRLGYDEVQEFLGSLDTQVRQQVSFSELMAGLQMMAEDTCSLGRCDPAILMQSVVHELEPTLSNANSIQLDRKRQQFSDRYDEMVGAFKDWDDIVPTGEGRRLDVLRGCFVGASNKRVVEALRVVYLDYSMLRVAGNTIFGLMSTLVNQIRKRKN